MVSTVRLTDPSTPLRHLLPRVSRDCDRAVIWLEGEQDIATVPALADALARTIAADDGDVIVDLRGVTFLDAATIGVMIRGRNFLVLDSRSLTLRSPSRSARRVLEVCRLTGLVEQLPRERAPSTRSASLVRMGS